VSNLEKSPIKIKIKKKERRRRKKRRKVAIPMFFQEKDEKLAEYSSAIIAKNVFVALQDVYRIHLSIPK